jgi:hypothetical protein
MHIAYARRKQMDTWLCLDIICPTALFAFMPIEMIRRHSLEDTGLQLANTLDVHSTKPWKFRLFVSDSPKHPI